MRKRDRVALQTVLKCSGPSALERGVSARYKAQIVSESRNSPPNTGQSTACGAGDIVDVSQKRHLNFLFALPTIAQAPAFYNTKKLVVSQFPLIPCKR